MMSKNLFIQGAMIAISIGIVITFVKPTFSEITGMQDDIAVYQTEQQKVSEVNEQLATLIEVLENVPSDDQRRLLTYMPDELDQINVVRDLSLISAEAGVNYISAEHAGGVADMNQAAEEDPATLIQPKEHRFALNVEGTYDQIKALFTLLEQNHYPIEVQEITVRQKEGSTLSLEATVSAYTHQDTNVSEEIVF